MEKRQLGRTDMQVGVLGFGGSEIGFEPSTAGTVKKLLYDALDVGLNVIDTSSAYLESEPLIGQAIADRRSECYLLTKCGGLEGFAREDWSHAGILKQVEQSLKNLRTDYLDVIQLHSCFEDELRKGEVITALQRAREKGYTRYIGYSGDGQAARYAVECGAFDTLQTSINIADQEALDLTLPLARESQMGIIAKRPIANVAWRTLEMPADPYHQTYWKRLAKLNYEFLGGDLKQAIAIALHWTISQPGVHTAIVGTTMPGRCRENAHALVAGPPPEELLRAIRERWRSVADETWLGQV